MDLDLAYCQHLERIGNERAAMERASRCATPWPLDQPAPGYLGTRCTKRQGHPSHHGTTVAGLTVEWA